MGTVQTPNFEDVRVGDEVTPLQKCPDTRQLVMYAGASDDYVQIHYDKDQAVAAGHPSVIVHGALKSAFIAQMLTDWIGTGGRLVALEVSYRGIDYPGDTLTCRGRVTAKRQAKRPDGDRNLVDCDVWLENSAGQVTTPGKATVSMP